MFDSYIIEAHSLAAGIVVRDGHQFRFFAAEPSVGALEGRLFRSPREAEKAVLRHLGRTRTGASPQHRSAWR